MAKAPPRTNVLSYASCNVAAAPVRREPSHRAEQTTQLLFGERVALLEIVPETSWTRIRCAWDGYEGWCKTGQLQPISSKDFHQENHVISTSHNNRIKMPQGEVLLPLGAELTGIKKSGVPVGETIGRFKGTKSEADKTVLTPEALLEAARSYLYAPYHWGGRSISGIDCSGLVQMAFKLCGFRVLRDAAQQGGMGREVHFLAEAQVGDVAFFDNVEGRIVHVGILSAQDMIIHATDAPGRVVEDRIDSGGIISIALKKRTHTLRAIRRIGL